MNLSTLKNILPTLENISFQLEDGTLVPSHFHVTEIGLITKKYIDCGGTMRDEQKINFQLWVADDFDHRLASSKLLNIVHLAEKQLGLSDLSIEVEYQGQTIETYALDFDTNHFILRKKMTDCLAKDNCGVPEKSEKPRIKLSQLQSSCCTPESSCC
jgi:hypothetical protein